MKTWKAVAGTLAMLMGISGAAAAQDWNHRDQDCRAGVVYTYPIDQRAYAYPNYAYNNNHQFRDRDRDRDRNKFRDHDRDHDRNRNERGDRDRR